MQDELHARLRARWAAPEIAPLPRLRLRWHASQQGVRLDGAWPSAPGSPSSPWARSSATSRSSAGSSASRTPRTGARSWYGSRRSGQEVQDAARAAFAEIEAEWGERIGQEEGRRLASCSRGALAPSPAYAAARGLATRCALALAARLRRRQDVLQELAGVGAGLLRPPSPACPRRSACRPPRRPRGRGR